MIYLITQLKIKKMRLTNYLHKLLNYPFTYGFGLDGTLAGDKYIDPHKIPNLNDFIAELEKNNMNVGKDIRSLFRKLINAYHDNTEEQESILNKLITKTVKLNNEVKGLIGVSPALRWYEAEINRRTK